MGFSQGAMMSLFTGLRRQVAPRAILAFSGALVAPQTLQANWLTGRRSCWFMAKPMMWCRFRGRTMPRLR